MSKRSIVTARDAPVEKVVSAAGGLVIHGDTFTIDTHDRVELIDLTDRVMTHVRDSGVREGMISLWSMHTTCTLFINESQKALEVDIKYSSKTPSRATSTTCTTIRIIRTAIARTPIRTCAPCCSATRSRCRSAAASSCSDSGSA